MQAKYFFLLLLFLYTTKAQSFHRNNNETAEAFVKRITNREYLPHPVIETAEWDSTRKVIIYFVEDSEEESVTGYLLIPGTNRQYRRVLIDTIQPDDGRSVIESVLFANADKDKQREIVIMIKWPQRRRGAHIDGDFYDTQVYDVPDLNNPPAKLSFYKEISDKLDGGFEGETKTGSHKAKYKTVSSVRAALKKMGY
ncbi:hypothetical protein [Filimonas effusa]|uniref:Uncharacterized protein n=1 Tax=Filimonas effusa TaxID=2508721 RepID=A0A4Q1DEM6_9BACT|nr:hypothetical protein [Filimonas effusa]RXK87059.1 hypothetical protein ESB13_09815 [Filimonas effusa]